MTQSQTITKSSTEEERRQLIAQVLTAQIAEQIEQAARILRQWLAAHPEDVGMEDMFEVLELRKPM